MKRVQKTRIYYRNSNGYHQIGIPAIRWLKDPAEQWYFHGKWHRINGANKGFNRGPVDCHMLYHRIINLNTSMLVI